MNEIKFNNVEELYQRLIPALNSKNKELSLNGIKCISNEELFEYLAKKSWLNKQNLTLYDMVSDILSVSILDMENYLSEKYIGKEEFSLDEKNNI